jgi:hypothetical protein
MMKDWHTEERQRREDGDTATSSPGTGACSETNTEHYQTGVPNEHSRPRDRLKALGWQRHATQCQASSASHGKTE